MEGKFEIDDGTCQSYYLCLYDGVKFVRYNFTCRGTNVFNLETCVPPTEYSCTQTTLTPPTTTETPCTQQGRFQIADPNCQKYYFCFWDGGKYVRWNLTCPNNLRFNPTTQRCTLPTNYLCPTE